MRGPVINRFWQHPWLFARRALPSHWFSEIPVDLEATAASSNRGKCGECKGGTLQPNNCHSHE